MKYLLPTLIILLFAACATETWPEDLAGKRTLLQTKKSELIQLREDISKLESEIGDLDTTVVVKQRRLVTTMPVVKKDFKRFVEIQGAVQSDDKVMASSESGGRIVSMNLKEGQYVKKGALVATLDLEAIDKQIAELETSLELANDLYARQKRLWDQNIGSEVQFLQAKNNKERLEKSLETVRFQLTKGNVYAPISGAIDMVFLNAGEMAAPGQPIVQILNTSKVKVVADVPERYLPKIKRGQTVTVKFPALELERKANVSLLGRTINPANRTFAVEVNMANGKGTLKPNLLATMMINDFSQKDAVVVPIELVQQEVSGKSYVYVKGQGADGLMAKKQYVEVGESTEGEIIIIKGLDEGTELIMEGARGLAENELIEIQKTNGENNG